MSETIEKVLNLLVAGGAFAFLEYLINRSDKKQEKKEGLKTAIENIEASIKALKEDFDKRLRKAEKDALRTQLLVMISDYPHEKREILALGERYFAKPPDGLDGNWVMTDIFKSWLKKEGHSNPEWFKE